MERLFEQKPSLEDLVHFGILGMRWGVRKEDKLDKDLYKKAVTNVQKTSSIMLDRGGQFREKGISAKDYTTLDKKDVVFKKGSEVKRVTSNLKDDDSQDNLFVSTNERDSTFYRGYIPQAHKEEWEWVPKKYGDNYFEKTSLATKDLKSPSEKKRVDAYISLMHTKGIRLKDGTVVNGREYLKRQGIGDAAEKLTYKQLVLTYYGKLVGIQGLRNDPLNTAYFNTLKKKGYNALVDDNDRGIHTNIPILTLDARRSLKTIHVRQLTTKDIHKALSEVQVPEAIKRND